MHSAVFSFLAFFPLFVIGAPLSSRSTYNDSDSVNLLNIELNLLSVAGLAMVNILDDGFNSNTLSINQTLSLGSIKVTEILSVYQDTAQLAQSPAANCTIVLDSILPPSNTTNSPQLFNAFAWVNSLVFLTASFIASNATLTTEQLGNEAGILNADIALVDLITDYIKLSQPNGINMIELEYLVQQLKPSCNPEFALLDNSTTQGLPNQLILDTPAVLDNTTLELSCPSSPCFCQIITSNVTVGPQSDANGTVSCTPAKTAMNLVYLTSDANPLPADFAVRATNFSNAIAGPALLISLPQFRSGIN